MLQGKFQCDFLKAIRTIVRPVHGPEACSFPTRRMRALTCVPTCKSLGSARALYVYFKRSVTMQLRSVRVLHRASILMNSRKRHSHSGFFVTSLKEHSKWIVREVVMDPTVRIPGRHGNKRVLRSQEPFPRRVNLSGIILYSCFFAWYY